MVFQNFESADGTYYSREQLPKNAYSRVEQYLRELCLLEGSPLPVPQTRIEKLLNCLITGENDFEEPRSRIEGLIYALITGDESNIETCASRVEVLWYMLVKGLDAEALLGTKVNGKVVEDCFSRVESYLWNLLHNGGLGDSVLYELNNQVTMYNTIAESVNNGTLLGNTMVNIVGDNVIVEGEVTGTESFEYDEDFTIKSAILKGNTLVNLYQLEGTPYQFKQSSSPMRIMNQPLMQGKSYMIIMSFNVIDTDGKSVINFYPVSVFDDGTTKQETNFNVASSGITKIKYTPSKTVNEYVITIGANNFEGYNPIIVIKNAMIIEYQEGMENWDIPYFTDMSSVKMPVLTTTSEDGSKTNVLSCTGEVELNAVGEIKDEYNCLTGELTQRIAIRSYTEGDESLENVVTDLTNTYYILDEVVTQTVSPQIVDQDGNTISDLTLFANGQIITSSDTIPPTFEYGTFYDNRYELPALQSATYTIQNDGTPFTLNGVEYSGNEEQTIDNFGKIAEIEEGFQTDYTYETLKVEGETLVNILPEPSLRNSMENVSMQKLNEGYDEVNTVDGVVKSAILKGQTLVNIPTITIPYITNKNTLGWVATFGGSTHLVKANTKYYIGIFNYSNESKTYGLRLDPFTSGTQITINANDYGFLIATTVENITRSALILNKKSHEENNNVKVLFIEYQQGMENWDIPYFEGMTSVKMPVLTTTGKNLLPLGNSQDLSAIGLMVTQKDGKLLINGVTTGTADYRVFNLKNNVEQMKKFNSLPVGTTITLSNNLGKECYFNVTRNDSSIYLKNTITIEDGDKDISAFIRFNTNETHDNTELYVQIEYGAVATSYEPYKSNILTCNEEVELRGIGDVKDELNLITGEYIQKIGEIVLKGNEDWRLNSNTYPNNIVRFDLPVLDLKQSVNVPFLVDTFTCNSDVKDGVETLNHNTQGVLVLGISSTRLSESTVNGLCTYLQSNPITVQYQLARESLKTVDLSILDQDSAEVTELNSFANGHIQLSSNVADGEYSLVPSVDYEVLTSNSYHVDMATVGNTYTVKGDNTNELITYSDPYINDDTNLMMIEGNHTERSISYFEGMQSVKMSVLTTIGKNLLNEKTMTVGYISSTGEEVFDTANAKYAYTIISPNTTYYGYNFGYLKAIQLSWYDVNKTFLNRVTCSNDSSVISPSNAYYARIHGQFFEYNGAESNNDFSTVQIMLSTEPITAYEPYKSNILTTSEDVELRGIGDVKDELNLITGELTERIGEIVLDGSEGWTINDVKDNGVVQFVCHEKKDDNLPKGDSTVICNRLSSSVDLGGTKDNDIWIYNGNTIVVQLSSSTTVADFKTWLANNPLIFHYHFRTESVKTVDLSSITNQDGETIDALEYFENGHLYTDDTYNLGHFTYSPTITEQKRLISVSTISDKTLTTEDENIVIVKGNQLNETIPALEGRKLSAVENPTITLSDEDGTNSNSANFEGSFYKIPNFDADATTLNGETTRNSKLLSYNDLTTTWALNSTMASQFNTIAFISNVELLSSATNSVVGTYNNLFGDYKANDLFITDCEGVAIYNDQLCIRVNRARLETEDVDGLETYLATNEFECLYVVDEYTENVVVNGELSSYDGITIATVSSENNVLPTVSLQVETSNQKDLEAIATGYTLLENTQSETSTAIEEQESDIQTVSDELSETSDLESIILEMTNQMEGE